MIPKNGVKKLQDNTTNKMIIDDYISTINQKCEQQMQFTKKTIKLNDDDIIIPNIKNYCEMTKYNYKIRLFLLSVSVISDGLMEICDV